SPRVPCVRTRRKSRSAAVARSLVTHRFEKALHAVQPRMLTRAVIAITGMHRLVELAQQGLLLVGEVHRRLQHDAAEQIARRPAAHRLHALLAQAEYAPGLRFGRHFEIDVAAERRHFHGAAQRCRREAHRDFAGEVAAVALEDGVLADADLDVEISRRPAIAPGFAFAGEADAVAIVDACGHLHRQILLLPDPALAQTFVAGLRDHLAAPLTARAGLLDREDSLLHADLAGAMARLAGHGFGIGLGAASFAGLAFAERRELDFGLVAEHRLFQVELEVVAQIRAAKDLAPTAPTAAEDVAEHVAEDVAERIGRAEAATAAARGQALMAVLIVDRALLLVGQDFVGFLALLELLLGLVIV